MDLYNLFVSGEKIYKQIKKSPKELTYEDYLLMMDPFFISENDIIEIEKNGSNMKGGSNDEDDFGENDKGGTDDASSSDNKSSKKKGIFSTLFRTKEKSEKDIEDENVILEDKSEEPSQEQQIMDNEMKKDKKNALSKFKQGSGTFIKYFVIALIFGGGPLFIWFFVMYHTFKRMKSTYKWMIEPM
jgi:hypothetical protein